MERVSYYKYLLDLLSNMENINDFHNELKVDIYLTLLRLNRHNYQEIFYQNEINIIEDYLRKVNNLKVKIQLKRKENEINNIIKDLEDIYLNNKDFIDKYNKDKIDIDEIIKTKDSKKITILIDKLTKEKLKIVRNKDRYDKIRNILNNVDYINEYEIKDNTIIIKINDSTDKIELLLNDFYNILDYLLNINNYNNIFMNKEDNLNNRDIIINLINCIKNDNFDNKSVIVLILNKIINKEIVNYEIIDTSKFNIINIKITDLYSFTNNSNQKIMNTAKCGKASIPNSYLYNKLRTIVNNGMYYFYNDSFILENIENNVSDFKTSININDIRIFLKENLLNIINETTTI